MATDPAYEFEFAELDSTVDDYRKAREAGDFQMTMLFVGMMTAKLANIYKLSPPAGIIDVPAMFKRELPEVGGP